LPGGLAQTATRPAITGIAFMRVYTTNAPAASTFYAGTLGLEEKHVGNMLVFPVNRHQWVEVTSAPPPDPNIRMAAIAFTTKDVAALQRYLHAHGVEPESASHPGQLAIRDPEGNLAVFVQQGSSGPEASAAAASAPSTRAPSRRIIHVGFVVHDRAKEDAFWRGILGFTPYWHGGRTDDTTDYVSLQVPDGTDWLEFMLNQPTPISLKQAGVMNHFSLGVDRMNTVLAALQQNKCEGKACTSIQAGRDGKIQLNLYDPDQTRIEFMEFTPAMKPCCSPFTGKHPSDDQ
jgi:catechol 2,3-dioxygenase-like lactoylglutathione lyase family enzyme